MSDLEPKKRKQTKDSTLPTASFVRPEYNTHPNQQGNPPESNTLGQPMQQENGPPPSIIDRPDFSLPTSSSIHPFKLERFVDNKGNPRTRVYLGRLRYCINTFDVIIENDTTGATTYGSVGSTNTGDGTSHTHSAGDYSIPDHTHSVADIEIPDHEHIAGTNLDADAKSGGSITVGTSENGTNHTHSISLTAAAGSTSGTTGTEAAHTHAATGLTIPDHKHTDGDLIAADHTHDISFSLTTGSYSHDHDDSGTTTDTHTHSLTISGYTGSLSSGSSVDVSGDTGNMKNKSSNDDVEGSTAAGSSHSHSYTKDDHTHSVAGDTGNPSSHTHNYNKDDHSHEVSGRTGGMYDKDNNDNLTGQTAGVYGSDSTPPITGNSGSPSAHTHPLPDLSTSTSEADRFVCILGQPQGAGIISEVEPAGFTALKDSNDKDTVVKAKDLPIGDTYGSIFLKWKVILSDSDSLGAYSINAADVTIHRHSDPAKTAEQLIIDNTEKLTHLRGVDASNNAASGTSMRYFKRGSESEDDRTAYYYVKIGVSYDPNAAGTNSKTIEQMTYENVYWSPLFLSRYTGAIS